MDENALHDCRRAAPHTVERLAADIASDGSLGDGCQDLACFYKLPYLMQLAGRAQQAHRLLDYIRVRFLRPDGDFLTWDEYKTLDPVLALFPGYINGWVAMAAHKVGRFDLSFPAWNHRPHAWIRAPRSRPGCWRLRHWAGLQAPATGSLLRSRRFRDEKAFGFDVPADGRRAAYRTFGGDPG